MGKKKKRGNYKDSQEDQDDVSTDEDVNNDKSDLADLPNCPHVGKAVNPSSIKKALKPAWLRIGACGACKRANAPTRAPPVNLVKGKKSRFDWLRSSRSNCRYFQAKMQRTNQLQPRHPP